MQQCTCGGYPVANCTQCQNPLCNQHAYKLYAHPSTDEYKRLEAFLSKFPNPVVCGEKFDIAALVSNQLIKSYEDRHICLNCHQKNVQRDASELLKGLTIPEGKVDFLMWLFFDSPFRKQISISDHRYVPYLSDEELVRFWLLFSRRAHVPLATSSPVWEIGGRYVIDLTGKVFDRGSEVTLSSNLTEHTTYALHTLIEHTVSSLLTDIPQTNMPKEEKGQQSLDEYADELLQQWQQQHAAQQQHYQTLTTSLQQAAIAIAETMKQTTILQDAAVGRFFSKTVGWFVWIDLRIVHGDQPGEYFNSPSCMVVDALILSPRGILYMATASTGRLGADPRTIISQSKKLTEVEVASEEEFHDVRQKLADFAAKHNLQV